LSSAAIDKKRELTYTTDEVEKYKDVHRQTPLLGSKEVGNRASHHPIPDG